MGLDDFFLHRLESVVNTPHAVFDHLFASEIDFFFKKLTFIPVDHRTATETVAVSLLLRPINMTFEQKSFKQRVS